MGSLLTDRAFQAGLRGGLGALVVVGAAHLVGPDGLLAMLRSKGYQIEQL
jgi:uncharacterized protein YbaP (TraB family)